MVVVSISVTNPVRTYTMCISLRLCKVKFSNTRKTSVVP